MLLNQEIDNLFIHYFTRFFNVRGRYSFIILILCFINVYNIYIHAYLYNNVCQKVLVVQLYGYGKWRHVHLQFCPYFCACTFIVSVRIIILVFLFLSYNSKMCCIFGVQPPLIISLTIQKPFPMFVSFLSPSQSVIITHPKNVLRLRYKVL